MLVESTDLYNDCLMLDFTLKMYERLCRALVESGYRSVLMRDWRKAASDGRPVLYLRHDVDSLPPAALDLARIEREHGLVATYFFRCVPKAFDAGVIRSIQAMGMECGYHYETLDRAQGNFARAIEITRDDLARLRALAPVTTMAMHGNPLTKYDNRDLWTKYDYREFGIELEAYEIVNSGVPYFTDTGRNWDETRGNLLDMGKERAQIRLTGTPSLIAYVQQNRKDVCISAHPNRWSSRPAVWLYNLAYDTTGNLVKGMIKLVRK